MGKECGECSALFCATIPPMSGGMFLKKHFTQSRISFALAVAAFIGYTIGVGLFSLPYAIGGAGFFVGASIFFLLALVMLLVNTMYADIVVATPGRHRLVGYVRMYLGERWVGIAHVLNMGAFWGVLIVYSVLGGSFLRAILGEGVFVSDIMYQLSFFGVAFLWCLIGIRRIALLEGLLMGLFMIGVLLIAVKGFGTIHTPFYLHSATHSPIIAYGVVLFAFISDGVIPEMKEILAKRARRLRDAVLVGSMAITMFYAIFATVVFGVSGPATTPDAFYGLSVVMGERIVFLGAALGLVSVFTSFLLCAVALCRTWQHDVRLHHSTAWLATVSVPLLVLLLGNANALELMAAIGSFFGGCTALLILYMWVRAGRRHIARGWSSVSPWLVWILGAFLAAGVLIELERLVFTYAN